MFTINNSEMSKEEINLKKKEKEDIIIDFKEMEQCLDLTLFQSDKYNDDLEIKFIHNKLHYGETYEEITNEEIDLSISNFKMSKKNIKNMLKHIKCFNYLCYLDEGNDLVVITISFHTLSKLTLIK